MDFDEKKVSSVEMEHENIVFTRNLKAGRRIYYFDVKKSSNGDFFISITESQKNLQDSNAAGNATYKRHKLFLYKEDFDSFMAELSNVVSYAKGAIGGKIVTREEYGSRKNQGNYNEN